MIPRPPAGAFPRPGHPPGRARRVFAALWLSLAGATVTSSAAHANGRFPTSQYLVVGPGTAADTLVLRTTFGLVVSGDRGHSWQWLCEELFGYGSRNIDPAVALGSLQPDGAGVLVGLPDGLARTTDRCTSTRVPALADHYTGDMTMDPTGSHVAWVGTDATTNGAVWVSNDGGRSFTQRGPGLPGAVFTTLEVATSNPLRMYLGGTVSPGFRPVLVRSDDGGATLTEVPLDLHGGTDVWVSGVDPTNADVLYVRAHTSTADGGLPGTLLLKSTDGGTHFTVLGRTAGDMKGFALSDDGHTVWMGGPDAADRLQRAVDGGTFQQVSTVQVLCLRWHAGALYVCANDLADGFAVGRSDDQGRTVTPLLHFADLAGPAVCPPGTAGHDLCALRWPQVRSLLGGPLTPDAGPPAMPPDAGGPSPMADAGTPHPDAGRPGMDAGRAPTAPTSTCGCATPGVSHDTVPATLVAAVTTALARRRRRFRGIDLAP